MTDDQNHSVNLDVQGDKQMGIRSRAPPCQGRSRFFLRDLGLILSPDGITTLMAFG